jgi:hypothetical protein
MRIPIPHWLSTGWDVFCDYVNVPVYRKIRRIDVILAFLGLLVVGYYSLYGWRSAVLGATLYVLFMMMGLWLL